MKVHVASIVKQMSPEVRKAAEGEANARGLSLEKFIEDQLAVEITEAAFVPGSTTVTEKLRVDGINVRVDQTDHRPGGRETRVGTGVTVRF